MNKSPFWEHHQDKLVEITTQQNKDTEVKATFDDFDEDESGFLEKDEVGELMAELGLTLEDEDLDEAIAGMEAKDDQDGKIGFPEFLVWWNEKGKVQKQESLKKTIAERKASELEVERLEKEGIAKAAAEKAVASADAGAARAEKARRTPVSC